MIHKGSLTRAKNAVSDIGLWFFWFPLRFVFQSLPLRGAILLNRFLSIAAASLLRGLRRRLSSELSFIMPEVSGKQRDRIARDSIKNDVIRRIEDLFFGTLTKETMEELVSFTGEENLKESVSRGKGTIILLSHFGSFLMILPALGFRGYRVNQLAGPPSLKHHRWIHRRIFESREQEYARLPVTFLRTDIHIKKALNGLKKNELVAIAFDGREGNKWVPVRFFGKTAYFAPGPLRLAAGTGASIVPTYIVRRKDGTYNIVFEKPMNFSETDTEKNSTEHMQKLVDIFEKYVRAYPCHFAMIMHIIEKRAQNGIVARHLFADNNQLL